jgi:hypothetical protein
MGRPDIFSPDLKMLWDVKPDSIYGWSSGAEQINRYTRYSGYTAGTGTPLFGNQPTITLTGQMNRYEYRLGASGLVMYRALDMSPMEKSIMTIFLYKATFPGAPPKPQGAPLPMPVFIPVP